MATNRWCVICDRQLITCKRYISIDFRSSKLKKEPAFLDRLGDIVGEEIALFEPHVSKYLCEPCDVKVTKCIKIKTDLQQAIKDQFHETKAKHMSTSSVTAVAASPCTTPAGLHVHRVDLTKRKAVESPGTPSTRKPMKKRLHFDQPSSTQEQKYEVVIHDGKQTRRRELSGPWTGVAKALYQRDNDGIIQQIMCMDETRELVKEHFVKSIAKEAEDLCSIHASLFRGSTVNNLKEFDYKLQHQELHHHAPHLTSVLHAVAEGKRLHRNIHKTPETIIPGMMTAASILLNCRSNQVNSHQGLTSLILKSGGSKKSTFKSLHSCNICSSYDTALKLQIDFGTNFDAKVKEWSEEVAEAHNQELKLIESGSTAAVNEFQKQRKDSGYQLVMDNVDMVISARHTSKAKHGSDLHMVQMMAVKNRVSGHHLPNNKPTSSLKDIDIAEILPTVEDNKLLKQDWVILIGKIIAENFPELKWFASHLPREVPHDHMAEMKQKSEIVNLGVIMENENTTNGIYKIMHHLHQYVPGHDTDTVVPIISAGDLLTCERESACKAEQQNSKTASKRLEGLVPVIADFHALANFYQVIWLHLYDTTSSGDKGTLYSARNYLEARKVTVDPMKNINAASDLIQDYTVSLVIAAALRFFGLDSVTESPSKNEFKFDEHVERTIYVNQVLEKFIDEYLIPSTDELDKDLPVLSCPSCSKTYVSKSGLKKHMKNKHHGIEQSTSTQQTSSNKDAVFNYTRTALSLGMLAMDFDDARKMGDGNRVIRLYKFFLIHFKAAKKQKYSFQTLRLLAQVKCFLSPRLAHDLTWNRFINTTGKEKRNIEVDRELEHENRVFKESCQGLRGKVTLKSINRISRSAQGINSLITAVDKQKQVKKPSGKHSKKCTKDPIALALDLHKENIFDIQPGRRHFHFADFPCSVLSAIEVRDLYRWINVSLKKVAREHRLLFHKL